MVTSDRPGFNFPDGSLLKDPPASTEATGEAGSTPRLGRSPGEGNGNPLQYSCLEESDETEPLSAHTHTHTCTHTCLMFVWPWEQFMALDPGFLLWNVILTLHEAARVG